MGKERGTDRRAATDRRQRSERRRGWDARCAMFEVCRSKLHLALVIRGANTGGDTVVTRSIPWRKTAASLHSEQGEKELTEAFRSLASEERLAGARVRIALSGEFCVTRVVTGPTDTVRREFAELEERSLRYLTLGPGRKALASKIDQLDARHQHALLSVANQRTLDLLMRIAETTGLCIEAIEPSLTALGRCQAHLREGAQEACLIVQLDEGGAELGLCHAGRLLLDYRPGGRTGAEDIAAVVAGHLTRLERYLERYHSYLDAPLRQIYLTGDATAIERARTKFAQLRNLRVEILDPARFQVEFAYTDQPPGTDMAAVLGVAMLLYPAAAEQQGPNLIEQTLAQLQAPMRPTLIRSLLPMAAVLLVAAGVLLLQWQQRSVTAALQGELDQFRPVLLRAARLAQQLADADAKLAQLRDLDQKLPRPNWQGFLTRVRQSIPDDVWLDRLTLADSRTVSLAGASYTDTGIYDFVSYLKEVPGIAQIALEGTGVSHTATGPTTSFNLQVMLAEAASRANEEIRHD